MILADLPKNKIRGVFSDLDDTLTLHSLLRPSTVKAIYDLHKHGLSLVIVSGRPAGWADCLMRLFPLDAMIFENGAGLMVRENDRIKTIALAKDADLPAQRKRLQSLFDEMHLQIPTLKLATDQPYRLYDYAIDFNEEPPFLDQNDVDKILGILSSQRDITAKLSSIHINYWCGTHTKVTACEYLLNSIGSKMGLTKDSIVFSGDSPNDEPLFSFFEHTVGVANIQKYLDRMQSKPKYLTREEGGLGFEELSQVLLS